MAKLTNTQKYAIQGMLHNGLNIDQIATELDLTPANVEKYVESLNITDKIKTKSQKAKAKPKKINSLDVMGKTTTTGQKLGGAIMTKAASERGDEARRDGVRPPRDWEDRIHKIREE
jgi:predicted ArsR family transcriptional regulator